MNRCFIFAAGSCYGLRERPDRGDYVIAADGGYRSCVAAGIVPDLVLGDFDSMEQPDFANCRRVPVEKDDTDSMLAVRAGLDHGCKVFYLYGCTGGSRLDHTVANFQLLAFLCRNGAHGYLYDERFVYTVIENESLEIFREVDWGIVSVFSMGDRASGVTLRGLQYPLERGELSVAFPLGVSNHFVEEKAGISVEQGMLLICWQIALL